MRRLIIVGLALAGLFSHADSCFIDGANVPRCYATHLAKSPGDYLGVSWPVFTADNPLEVMHETERRWPAETGQSVRLPPSQNFNVKHVRIDTPEHYPDVMCIDFYRAGLKTGQTCFDTMEITER